MKAYKKTIGEMMESDGPKKKRQVAGLPMRDKARRNHAKKNKKKKAANK